MSFDPLNAAFQILLLASDYRPPSLSSPLQFPLFCCPAAKPQVHARQHTQQTLTRLNTFVQAVKSSHIKHIEDESEISVERFEERIKDVRFLVMCFRMGEWCVVLVKRDGGGGGDGGGEFEEVGRWVMGEERVGGDGVPEEFREVLERKEWTADENLTWGMECEEHIEDVVYVSIYER